MNTVLKYLLAANFVLAAGATAQAQERSGIYISAALGPDFVSGGTPSLSQTQEGTATQTASGLNTGGQGSISVGWSFGNELRAEIEAVVMGNNGRTTKTTATLTGSASRLGEVTAGVLGNVFYDFRAPTLRVGSAALAIQPYLGAGFGYVSVYRKNSPAVAISGSPATYDDTAGAPAGQLIGGIAVPVAARPGLAVTLDYRLMEIAGSGHRTVKVTAGGLQQAVSFNNGSQTDQSILLGFRYDFGG